MKRITTYLLLTVMLIVVSATSFYCGGCVGFSQGYNFAIAKDAPRDADTSIYVISMIKENKINSAVSFLEKRLDSAIVRHWYHVQNPPSFYGVRFYDKLRLVDQAATDRITTVCKYRKENPHDSDKTTRNRIETILKHYLKI